jgi:hypothetical protein
VTTRNDSVSLADGFSYFEVTRLLDVVPGAGSDAGGELVTLKGRGLADAAQVLFGGIEATIVSSTADTVTVLTPAGASGPVDVLVYALSGGGDLLADGYLYTNASTPAGIVAIRPASGSIDGGDLVTVVTVGSGARDTVRFAGLRASPVSSAGGTFVVRTPAGSLGAVDLSLTGGTDAPLVAPGAFTYLEPMELLELDPPTGDVAGGTEVVFRGTGFEAGTTVRFGALAAASVAFVSSEELRVVTPPGTVGSVPVTLLAPSRTLSYPDAFRYTQPLTITGYSPTRGAIAGGTYVVVRGSGFEPGLSILFGDQPALSVELLDPATVAVRTPPAESAAPVVVKAQLGTTTVNGPGKFTYYNPTTDAGGWWGGDILGAVNVTVVDSNGPVSNAFVTLSVRASETGFSGRTDARGQVTISGPDLSGVQNIYASAKKHSSVSVTRVNASNVVVVLQYICGCYTGADCEPDETCDLARMVPVCVSPQSCTTDADCSERPNFICEGADETLGLSGICAEDCSGEPPEPPPLGTIFGLLRGLDKITVPGPNQRLRAFVVTTENGPATDPGPNNNFIWDGTRAQPYELNSRLGDVVVVGLCGVEDLTTGNFEPRYMAIYRPLFVEGDQRYEVNFECDIHLNQSLQVKVINPPFAPGGAEVNRINATLEFGGEGSLSIWETQSTASISTVERLAPLEGQLAGLNYGITARAEPNGGGVPFSQAMQRNVVAFDALLTMPTYIPPARGITPGPGERLVVSSSASTFRTGRPMHRAAPSRRATRCSSSSPSTPSPSTTTASSSTTSTTATGSPTASTAGASSTPEHSSGAVARVVLFRQTVAGHAPACRGKGGPSGRHPLLPHGRLLRALLRRRGIGVARARPHAHLAVEGDQPHPDGGRPLPCGGRLHPPAHRQGLPCGHLRPTRRPRRRQGRGQAGRHPGHHTRPDDRRPGARGRCP